MSYHFVNQIKFLKNYSNVFYYVGLMPKFDFELEIQKNGDNSKIYSIIWCFCCTCPWLYGFLGRLNNSYEHLPVLQMMITCLMETISIFMLNYASLSTNF